MISDRTYEEAADWLVRQQDDAMDWDGFTSWLEADPSHLTAYDKLALLDRQLDEVIRELPDEPGRSTESHTHREARLPWRRFAAVGSGAIAAGIAALLLVQPVHQAPATRDIRTQAGQKLEVALEGGARVLLAPASHLQVRGPNISLEGDGYFDVPHKRGRLLTITAGPFQISDIGTKFSVESDPDRVSVEVAQGSLEVSSNQLEQPVALSAGHGMRANKADGTIGLFTVAAQQVASWRSGKLEFNGAPLALVVREISRYSGKPVTVDARIANQPFSGVIVLHDGEAPARTLAQILSLDVTQADGTMRLEPRGK